MSFKPRISFTLIFKVSFSILALWFLLHSKLLTPSLITNLFTQPLIFLIIMLLMLLTLLLSSWRWYRLNIAQDIKLTLFNTFYLTYIGLTFNNLLPGGISGDVIRLAGVTNKSTRAKSSAMLSLMVDRLMGLMGVAVLMTIIVGMKVKDQLTQSELHYVTFSSLIFMMIGLIVIFILPKEIGVTAWFKRIFGEKTWAKVIINLLESIQVYRSNRIILLDAIITSVFIQIIIAITIFVIAHSSLFIPISLLDCTVASMTTQIANWIPVTPGGLGVGEIVFAKTLTILNQQIILSSATVYLIYRLMNLVFSLPGILVYLIKTNWAYQRIKEV